MHAVVEHRRSSHRTCSPLGAYVFHDVLGVGSMGMVYAATERSTGRAVAVKVTSNKNATEPLREAEYAARVDHPNVARVFSYGIDDGAFVVMRRLNGPGLNDVLRRRGPLDPELALSIAAGIGRGLAACHDAGIVHRDLKPENVMLTTTSLNDQPQPVLIDFGVARCLDDDRVVAMEGTLAYMSREQAFGSLPDVRSDLFSFGCVLWEMLTGQPPFSEQDNVHRLSGRSPRLRLPPAVADALCPEVQAILERMLHPNVESRPANAQQVIDALTARQAAPFHEQRAA